MKTFLLILEWILLSVALVAFTITESYQETVISGLAFLSGSFVLRALRSKRIIPRTGLEIPWLIGLTGAAIATWIAYDRPTAFLQFSRILAAFVLYYAVVDLPEVYLPWIAGAFLIVAAGLAIYFPVQYDYNTAPVKIAFINQAGNWIRSSFLNLFYTKPFASNYLSLLLENTIHANIAAGTLAVAVPFGFALSWKNLVKRTSLPHLLLGILAVILTLVVLGGLLLTSSRGALMALVITGLLAGMTMVQRRWFGSNHQRIIFWAGIFITGILIIGFLVFGGQINRLLGGIPDPGGTIHSRTELWAQGLELIGDYPFTGSGLMTFWMVHGGYNLQLFIPFIAHVHNTFLETWIEQGILGIIAIVTACVVVFSWFWKALKQPLVNVLGWAGMAALCVALIHGMVDVVFSVSRTLPIVGFITGYAWWINYQHESHQQSIIKKPSVNFPEWVLYAMGVSFAIFIGIVLLLWRPMVSAWYSNQGALAQTRFELSQYDPKMFQSISIDRIRREATPEQLAPIYANFSSALSFNPENRTALQRLAQIAFSRGEYEQSLDYAQRLWSAGFRDDTTRLLYGDALIASGDISNAALVLKDLTWAEDRLMATAWYRYWTGGDAQRAADFWRVVLMLNPGNSDADHWLKVAQSLIQENPSP